VAQELLPEKGKMEGGEGSWCRCWGEGRRTERNWGRDSCLKKPKTDGQRFFCLSLTLENEFVGMLIE
jgi:hypothetical protein